MYYNFARVHQTLRVMPAMEAEYLTMYGAWKKLLDYWIETDPLPHPLTTTLALWNRLRWVVLSASYCFRILAYAIA